MKATDKENLLTLLGALENNIDSCFRNDDYEKSLLKIVRECKKIIKGLKVQK